jgi:hypothetical protein
VKTWRSFVIARAWVLYHSAPWGGFGGHVVDLLGAVGVTSATSANRVSKQVEEALGMTAEPRRAGSVGAPDTAITFMWLRRLPDPDTERRVIPSSTQQHAHSGVAS